MSLDFVRGIHGWQVNSPHKGPCNAKKVYIWWRYHDIAYVRFRYKTVTFYYKNRSEDDITK